MKSVLRCFAESNPCLADYQVPKIEESCLQIFHPFLSWSDPTNKFSSTPRWRYSGSNEDFDVFWLWLEPGDPECLEPGPGQMPVPPDLNWSQFEFPSVFRLSATSADCFACNWREGAAEDVSIICIYILILNRIYIYICIYKSYVFISFNWILMIWMRESCFLLSVVSCEAKLDEQALKHDEIAVRDGPSQLPGLL